ncbi:MAG: hypothetical protein ACXWV4_13750 [Flavitalea sp.]
MKNSLTIIIGCFIILLSSAGCNKLNLLRDCVGYTTAQVTEVKGPNTTTINQEMDLTIFYFLSNGCGRFENLEATSSESEIIIKLKAKYEGCICTAALVEGQTIYKFKARQKGVHYLKFLQPNKTYLTYTITVT